MIKEKTLIVFALVGAALLVGAAYLPRGDNQAAVSEGLRIGKKARGPNQKPALGAPGSEHSHAVLVLFIEDTVFDFAQPRYMLRDERAHFENGDGLTLHKHSTGVTLPYFLKTLGIRIDPACLTLDTGARYCSDGQKKIRLIVNGEEVVDPDFYEVQDNDRILLNYGADSDVRLRLKLNNLPPVVSPFRKPF